MVMSELSVDQVAAAIVAHLCDGKSRAAVDEALGFEVKGIELLRNPSEGDLPLEQLRCVLRYWESLPRIDAVPDVLKVDPDALRGALGYMMLIDIGREPNDFRYALYGSRIAAVAGFDMTGRSVWEVSTTSAVRTFFAACYRAALELRSPLYTVHRAPPHITASHWHRLILPLGRTGEIKRFLVCNTPIQDGSLI